VVGREDDDQFGVEVSDESAGRCDRRLDVVKEFLRWSRKVQ
jgi:hypothetical protein